MSQIPSDGTLGRIGLDLFSHLPDTTSLPADSTTGPVPLQTRAMTDSRLIRAAVNLSLMITLMVQPVVAACTMGNRCSAVSAASDTCSSCGSCRAIDQQNRCKCCGGGEVPTNHRSGTEPNCCSHKSSMQDGVQGNRKGQEHSQRDDAVENSAVCSLCLCRLGSQPLSAPTQSSAENETRQLSPVGFVSSEDNEGGNSCPLVVERHRGPGPAGEHFSQIVLCVWRL